MLLYRSKMACRIHGFLSLTLYSQPPVGVEKSESKLITQCYSFQILYTPVSLCSLAQARRTSRCRALSNGILVGLWLLNHILGSERCTVRLLTVWLATSFNWVGMERRRVVLSLSLMVFSFLPASNLLVTVGFVVAERVLYIPR
ncbi:hypothetical protein TNCV_494571 [Trichonephila clavipes]|nr:hypothetical protein TNCV_494571 [Trichonephila clavipes]